MNTRKIITFILICATVLDMYLPIYASASVLDLNVTVEPFSPTKMDDNEKKVYYSSIEKQVELVSQKHGENFSKKLFRNRLVYFLEKPNSFNEINRDVNNKFILFAGSWLPDIKIENDIVAAAINVAIDMTLVAVGVDSVVALVKKVGIKEARKIFTKTLASKLTAWGLGVLTTALPVAVDFIFNLLDPGSKIAKYLDSKDDFPGNGYLDIVL